MWTLENAHLSLGLVENAGQMRHLTITPPGGSPIDLFEQLRGDLRRSVGGVAVTDELAGRHYSDLQTDGFTITDVSEGADSLSVTKRYDGAGFDVTTGYALEGDELTWRVRVQKVSGPDRSLQIYQFLPQLVGWSFWAPADRTPFALDGMSSFEYFYVNGNGIGYHDIVMPLVSVYDSELDAGLAVALPFDARIPAAKFQSVNGHRVFAWGSHRKTDVERMPYLEIVQYFIGLQGDEPLEVSCILRPTVGDWRPALGWAVEKWRHLFYPATDRMYEREGIYYCGGPLHADHIDELLRYNARFLELHSHFPHYGLYYPEGEGGWHDIAKLEHGKPNLDRELTVPELGRRIEKLSSAGVNVYFYFQLSDGYRPWVEERFPESIAKNEDGTYQPSGWRLCHNMNADLSLPWGQYQLDAARRIIDAYPGLAGFFLDCWRHFELDFAHDDGVTMVNNTPCYSVNFHYDEITRQIARLIHDRGLETFANKPHTIRSCGDIDSILMEGAGDDLEWMLFYAAVACPYYYLWTSRDLPTEEWLKRSLAFGAYPMAPRMPRPAADADTDALYDAYLPLYELLRRRVLSFDPDPITLPIGTWGQLYSVPGDRHAGVIVRDGTSYRDAVEHIRAPEVEVRLPRELGSARIHYPGPDAAAGAAAAMRASERGVVVPLEQFRSAAVIVLE
jgi:hypothetical protein